MSEVPGKQLEAAKQLPTNDLLAIIRERLEANPQDAVLLDQITALNSRAQELAKPVQDLKGTAPSSSADADTQSVDTNSALESENPAEYFANIARANETFLISGYSSWRDFKIGDKTLGVLYPGTYEAGYAFYGPRHSGQSSAVGEPVTSLIYRLFVPGSNWLRKYTNEPYPDTKNLAIVAVTGPMLKSDAKDNFSKNLLDKLPDSKPFHGISFNIPGSYWDPSTRRSTSAPVVSFALGEREVQQFVGAVKVDPRLPNMITDTLFPGLFENGNLHRQETDKLLLFDFSKVSPFTINAVNPEYSPPTVLSIPQNK